MRTAKYILINALVLPVADMILIIVNLFVDLPRLSALLAPLCLTAGSVENLLVDLKDKTNHRVLSMSAIANHLLQRLEREDKP